MSRNLKWIVVFIAMLLPVAAHAAVAFESLLKMNIDAPIVDVTTNPADDLVFLLTPGAVLIYSPEEKTVLDRIPLDEPFDRIAFLDEDRLVLTSTNPSRIQVLGFNRIHTIDVADHAFKGPADAKVTLVVFDDYQCPYCARLDRFVMQVLQQYPDEVKYVIKHFPLPSHPFAYQGAMAALAAGKQGKFWEFHSRLLESHDQVDEEKIVAIAGELALNMDQFKVDREAAASRQLIQDDIANGKAVGVSGTPTVFLNGKRVRNRDLGTLPQLILRELGR